VTYVHFCCLDNVLIYGKGGSSNPSSVSLDQLGDLSPQHNPIDFLSRPSKIKTPYAPQTFLNHLAHNAVDIKNAPPHALFIIQHRTVEIKIMLNQSAISEHSIDKRNA